MAFTVVGPTTRKYKVCAGMADVPIKYVWFGLNGGSECTECRSSGAT